jgi:hypothetical protein
MCAVPRAVVGEGDERVVRAAAVGLGNEALRVPHEVDAALRREPGLDLGGRQAGGRAYLVEALLQLVGRET